MAKRPNTRAFVLEAQSVEGTVGPAAAAATLLAEINNDATGEGLALLPIGDSYVAGHERVEEDPLVLPGAFTKSPGSYIRTDNTLTFDFYVKGGGITGAGDYVLHPAIAELFKGLGIIAGTPSAQQVPYNPSLNESFLSIRQWRGKALTGDFAETILYKDCKVESMAFAFTGGETCVCSVTMSMGPIEDRNAVAFPDFSNGAGAGGGTAETAFGSQLTLPNPIMKAAGSQLGSTVIGWRTGTLTLTREQDDEPDVNAALGIVSEKSGFTVNFSGEMFIDTFDASQHLDLLENLQFPGPTPRNPEPLVFTLGVPASDPSEAVRFNLDDIVVTSRGDIDDAGNVTYNVESYATSASPNQEITITGV